jgi:hypothetical protein
LDGRCFKKIVSRVVKNKTMNKDQAYQMVLTLLDAAVKGGLFKSAADVMQISQAVQILKPENKKE